MQFTYRNTRAEIDPHEKECQEAGAPFYVLLFLHVIFSLALIIFTPESILQYELVRKLISIPATLAPAFMDVPNASQVPDVVRFYFGVMWMLYPAELIMLFFLYFRIPVQCFMENGRMISYKSRIRSSLWMFLYVVFIIYGFFYSALSIYKPVDGRFSKALFLSRFTMCYGSTIHTLALLLLPVLVFMYGHMLFYAWKDLPWFYKKH